MSPTHSDSSLISLEELQDQVRVLQEQLDDSQSRLNREANLYKQLEGRFTSEYQLLLDEKHQTHIKLTDLTKANESLEEQVAQLTGSLKRNSALSDQKVADLTSQLTKQERKLDLLSCENEGLRRHANKLTNGLAAIKIQVVELTGYNNVAKKTIEDLHLEKKNVAAIERERDQLARELEDARERNKNLVEQIQDMIQTAQLSKATAGPLVVRRPQAPPAPEATANKPATSNGSGSLSAGPEVTARKPHSNGFDPGPDNILSECSAVGQDGAAGSGLASDGSGKSTTNWSIDRVRADDRPAAANQCRIAARPLANTTSTDPWIEERLADIFSRFNESNAEGECQGKNAVAAPPPKPGPIQETPAAQQESTEKKSTAKGEGAASTVLQRPPPFVSEECILRALPEGNPGSAYPMNPSRKVCGPKSLQPNKSCERASVSVAPTTSPPSRPTTIPNDICLDNSQLIREIIFRGVPADCVEPKEIFKQINRGMVQKVTFSPDRISPNRRVLRIVFVEPSDARDQHAAFCINGLRISSGGNETPLVPEPLSYTGLKPMEDDFRRAIYVGGLSRVLRLSGSVEGFTEERILRDIEGITNQLQKYSGRLHELVDEIQIDEEQDLILLKFTCLIFCARVFKAFKEKAAYNMRFAGSYGRDPCDPHPVGHSYAPEEWGLSAQKKKLQRPSGGNSRIFTEHRLPTNPEMQPVEPNKKKPTLAEEPSPGLPRCADITTTTSTLVGDKTDTAQDRKLGRIGEPVGLVTGRRPGAGGSKWDYTTDAGKPAMPRDNWAANEQSAIRAYNFGCRERESEASARKERESKARVPAPAAAPQSDFKERLVCLKGLPAGITYATFCPFVKGGAVDAINLSPTADGSTAAIVFVRSEGAANYRCLVANRGVRINNCLIQNDPNPPGLRNMRLFGPARIISEGLSRCLVLEGLPPGTTAEALEEEIAKLNEEAHFEYDRIRVSDLKASICCPSIATAHLIWQTFRRHPNPSIKCVFGEDYCQESWTAIGTPYGELPAVEKKDKEME